jgi:hypothetical protein
MGKQTKNQTQFSTNTVKTILENEIYIDCSDAFK